MESQVAEGNFEDAVLVRRVQAGEVHAFNELVTKYQDRVFNTCWRICGDHADAGELTQDVFMKAFQAIGRFHGKSAFYTWVFRIAVNQSLSWKRKQANRKTVSLDASLSDRDGSENTLRNSLASETTDDPATHVVATESQRLVTDALAQLDPDQQAVLVLRDIEGMDYQNIADILEVAVGTVKSRIYRGRMSLRALLCDTIEQPKPGASATGGNVF
ncbi:MAG: RNA polymerase sigma factor [Phycisphaerae bacterium]|nr:MAG: RNA polymerase sigma factor [Phycisphaerae bacterium]